MSAPLVSILLPVYNGEKTLKATIESLRDQTFTDFEIIIGIDGTKDKSKAIALAFDDSRIKVIEHPQNLGLANNLNAIIKHASPNSLYFAMAEQDDIYVPERLEWQVEVMKNDKDVGLVSGIVEYTGVKKNLLFPGLLLRSEQFPQGKALFKYLYVNQLKVVNTCMLWQKAIHLENDLKFKNTYGNFNVDWDYVLRFSLISKIHGLPKKLVTMNRIIANDSVTANAQGQQHASKQLLKDFKNEFSDIVTAQDYKNAMKVQHKIELGSYSKVKIVVMSIVYFLKYKDSYFMSYLCKKIKSLLSKA
ncbi:glycosyltransferase family 2 protein [Winogradskyella haliclonae]|uniref:Glycosyltransferase 2-like domain-containing protein n=1 Tax=Winogradskyella haliclonae TaxID=2048558 RepID=A0ABQ2BZY1_9FLAO|nr:glycosyltransferase family 2 protein [Winogradskyella haliclonae]GGI58037.1 hypothetical protein GCM10011444_23460 [Winogradskyella haliclonae]